MKLTDPSVTGLPPAVTVAVNVTEEPVVDGDPEVATVVDVETACSAVVIVTDQPPATDPVSPLVSSTMNSRHVPLGSIPENAPARVVSVEAVGAGAGNVSPDPSLVGW